MAGLADYRRKRRFSATPEPAGSESESAEALHFVVHKHHASHLHYDFRLELDGTLKSWAVPKGPSLKPTDKRLALMVEDHPLDYATFEGVIPVGNYGAGEVIVWDAGTYVATGAPDRATSEPLLRAGLAKGHLAITLFGEKLRGEFDLVHTAGRGKNAWLLVKRRDTYASSVDVLNADRSVQSGRSIAELERREDAPHAALDLSAAPRAPLPTDVRPMLATLIDAPFDRAGWIFEIKWDGYRAIATITPGHVDLRSRRGLDFRADYPAIAEALRAMPHTAVLDGEIVALDEVGRPRFQLLQDYDPVSRVPLVYYVFDILHLDGHDLTRLPLLTRKSLLVRILAGVPSERIRYADHVTDVGTTFFRAAAEQGLEGIIAKDGASRYDLGKRGRQWLKIRTHKRQEAIICGFTRPRGGRKEFGSLILGAYRDRVLTPIGHVGTGFDDALLSDIANELQPLIRDASPFSTPPPTNAPPTWVEPRLVAEIKFTEWTTDGRMRHPVFLGLRPDKQPRDVLTEEATPVGHVITAVGNEDTRTQLIAGQAVTFTHLAKVWWPAEGYTKGDVIAYYREIAPVILPYLRDRPEVLLRHPHGITGSHFYQKNMTGSIPSWVPTVVIPSDSRGRDISYLLCQDEATLALLANLGCIEVNPWHARITRLTHPDYLAIDLDPLDIGFDAIIRTAREVKRLLDEIGAVGVPKTSGKRGLHIFVPLGAQYDTQQVGMFAELLVRLLHARLPAITSIARSPRDRVGRVYLDYLQNRHGQTIAAAYSLRPVPGAPVSTPLRWTEVKKGLDPQRFTLRTMPARLAKVGDLWQPVLGPGIDLAACLARMEDLG